MIELLLQRLFAASQMPSPAARIIAYTMAVNGAPRGVLVGTIAVLTEGAMLGPDAARGMARELGG